MLIFYLLGLFYSWWFPLNFSWFAKLYIFKNWNFQEFFRTPRCWTFVSWLILSLIHSSIYIMFEIIDHFSGNLKLYLIFLAFHLLWYLWNLLKSCNILEGLCSLLLSVYFIFPCWDLCIWNRWLFHIAMRVFWTSSLLFRAQSSTPFSKTSTVIPATRLEQMVIGAQ